MEPDENTSQTKASYPRKAQEIWCSVSSCCRSKQWVTKIISPTTASTGIISRKKADRKRDQRSNSFSSLSGRAWKGFEVIEHIM